MSRGKSDDSSNLMEIENHQSATKKDEFTESYTENLTRRLGELVAERRRAAEARVAEVHALFVHLEAKQKALRRSEMDKKLADPVTNKIIISAAEQFVEDYQNALDSVREDFANYISAATNEPHPPPPPLPPQIAFPEMLPPSPILDANSVDYDDDVAETRCNELDCYHEKQSAEADQIREYDRRAAALSKEADQNRPPWYSDDIEDTLVLFTYKLICATEACTDKLGDTGVVNLATHEASMRWLQVFRQLIDQSKDHED
ncbi:hypothetical protein ABFS82_11G122900 [Erythranthe guttata]|uniref:merlin-like n=1 Tax=Erythranthe guttata TaxID=4155 RepID=UPI00064DA89E|nr:PREDICTED: merlin-like [Erythranthe guttata]|eukprot:XP_012840625.1 PREDICTED: merlin-like [Erythranthe guttata]